MFAIYTPANKLLNGFPRSKPYKTQQILQLWLDCSCRRLLKEKAAVERNANKHLFLSFVANNSISMLYILCLRAAISGLCGLY